MERDQELVMIFRWQGGLHPDDSFSLGPFGLEVWGARIWMEQLDVGRKLLDMGSKTRGEAIRGDLGWWTLKGRRDYARLRFWHKVVNAPDTMDLSRKQSCIGLS